MAICEHFYVHVCGINDLGHTYDEYLVLFTKSGMTPAPSHQGEGDVLRTNAKKYLHNAKWRIIPRKASHMVAMWRTLPRVRWCSSRP
jgi:hypothetical protein